MRVIVLVAFFVLPTLCHAETWVEVKGGKFAVPVEALDKMKSTLRQKLQESTRSRKLSGDAWGTYLIQYRGVHVAGRRALEIHGSCAFNSPDFDVRSSFYEEMVMDGGECYFVVYYMLKTGRYSNVIFHGIA